MFKDEETDVKPLRVVKRDDIFCKRGKLVSKTEIVRNCIEFSIKIDYYLGRLRCKITYKLAQIFVFL